ncbi:kinase-like protein, partial [Ramicandelaber brevisporus]
MEHAHVIRTFAYVAEDDGSFHVVMEALPRDLFSEIQALQRRVAAGECDEAARMAFIGRAFAQIVSAVAYMHSERRVAHRDLKLENICIDEHGTPKLIDFGCSTRFAASPSAHVYGVCGSDPYIAPEVFASAATGAGYDGRAADVWALGIIFLAMVSAHFPW